MSKKFYVTRLKPVVFLMGAVFSHQAMASGYHFGVQSVNAQGTANASAAEAKNASTIFANPAGLSQLERNQISASVTAVMPYIKYSNAKAEYYRGGEVKGSDSGVITPDVVPAPHFYGAYKLNNTTTLGLGVFIPYGSQTDYQRDSKLKYNLNHMAVKSVAIEPTVSFKLDDKHAVAVGVVAQYTKAKLRKYADWSASSSDARVKGVAALVNQKLGATVATGDRSEFAGYANVKGDDWAVGYHAGWMMNVNERTRVGLAYRSKIKHKLEGSANWFPEGVIAKALYDTNFKTAGYVANEKAHVEIITPESASLHGMHKVSDKLDIFGDVTWTKHSRFNKADVVFENNKPTPESNGQPAANVSPIKPNWRDTFRVAVGGSYQLSHPLQVRAGIAFDQSPVRRATERMNTLPDGNRMWYSVGLKYDFTPSHSLDVAYSHVHINDTVFSAAKASGTDTDSKGVTSANFKNYANIVGLQYTYQF